MAKHPGRKPAEHRSSARDLGDESSPSLALLWGTRARPARGPKPVLTLDAVVRAAIDVADADGIGALTMTRVAERLDVTTMAIYRYVPRKEELVDLMNDHALGPPPAAGGGTWRVELARWARTGLSRFQGRPWLLETATRRVPIGPNWLGWLDAGLRALERSGLPPHEMISAVMLVDGHVRATAELSSGAAATERWARDFGRVLASVIGDSRFPALTQVATAKGFSRAPSNAESPFEFGLERILDGLEARASSRRSRRR
jgi:AcrR family transcriptional regulator